MEVDRDIDSKISTDEMNVWKQIRHAPPDYVTDRGIAVAREYDYDRIILHYVMPHDPYAAEAIEEERLLKDMESNPFEYLKDVGDRQKIYSKYVGDLRYILGNHIRTLLNNIDADHIVISADHGEAFGEFGSYRHPSGSLNPYVRKVPWVPTSGNDSGTYTPCLEPIVETERNIDDFLEAMGYK